MTARKMRTILVAAFALLAASCASSTAPVASSAADPVYATGSPVSSGVCAGDSVVATFKTAYDGTQPLCRGFAGDADHAGEGLAGTATSQSVTKVVASMLLGARAIYSFQPPAAWMAARPHPRDVNGDFHRQSNPAPGDTKLRAYKDYLTPAPGQAGNEQQYAMFAAIVSPGGQPGEGQSTVEGGVWFIGCLVFHSDGKEYMEACPSWVWTVPVVPAVKKRL